MPEDTILVTVFETGDPGLVALVESILQGAGIEFIARGEGVQDLFGWGRLGVGFSLIAGPVLFQVEKGDAEVATELLRELGNSGEGSG